MKRIIFLTTMIICTLHVYSQIPVATAEQVDGFYKSKTMVVLENALTYIGYNTNMKKAAQKVWKATDYEFISYEKFEELKMNADYSFLIMSKIRFNSDRIKPVYLFLNLVRGGAADKLNKMPRLCAVPLAYEDVEDYDYAYKLESMLQFIQQHVKITKENPGMDAKKILRYYNKNLEQISGKTLYVVKDDLSKGVDTAPEIKQYYSGDVKIITHNELETVIEKQESAEFLHKIGPEETKKKARCWKIIMGVDDGKLYYWNRHTVNAKTPDGFLAKSADRAGGSAHKLWC